MVAHRIKIKTRGLSGLMLKNERSLKLEHAIETHLVGEVKQRKS
jgi:hypothetical protein